MLTFGDRLRAEREKRNVSLDQIAASTRIRRHHLDALERNAFSELPGPVFNRGYVRAYAAFLGTDPEPLLKAYSRELRVRELPEQVAGTADPLIELRRVLEVRGDRSRHAPSPRFLAAVGLVAVLSLGALGAAWWILRSLGDRPSGVKSAAPPPVEAIPEPPAPTPLPVEAAPEAPIIPPKRPLPSPIAATPRPAPAPPQRATIGVPDYGVGTGVVHRALVGRGERFVQGSEVWFWTLVVDGGRGDQVHHVWTHAGRVVRTAELSIGGPRWRTYSRLRLPAGAVGDWAVEARDEAGAVLARVDFACTARADR
jgi:transcriptional regulator with XRE-family HTH domain